MKPPFLTRVRIKNYKSIAACDVELGPLTFLLGPNGSGKSNFLDAIRFVADALNRPIDHALRDRGGINEVRRRSTGHPTHFGIALDFRLSNEQWGSYTFEVGAEKAGGFSIRSEQCRVFYEGKWREYRVDKGNVTFIRVEERLPDPAKDRLYLVLASNVPSFRVAFDALAQMAFYSLNPTMMRELQSPDATGVLAHDGGNVASVFRQLTHNAKALQIVQEYLGHVVPGLHGVEFKALGPKETLEFLQEVPGGKQPWRFFASNMSDGTLRAFGVLVALFQASRGLGPLPFIGVEEPETALHPAAAGVLRGCLREASRTVQVAVTSHSPDLLDDSEIATDSLLAVVSEAGETKIGPVDPASRTVLHDKLFTPGELLRMDQLRPDPAKLPSYRALDLFSDGDVEK